MTTGLSDYLAPLPLVAVLRGITPSEIDAVGSALLLSGFLFDVANMPIVLRTFTYIVPARYYITVTRGIFLKGVGLESLWPQGISMVVFAIVGLSLAAAAFKKRIAA